jgi:hypothetical protein
MPKGARLKEAENAPILAFAKCGRSQRDIAKEIKCSKPLCNNFSANPDGYGS